MDNKALIEKFYTAFAAADANGMTECYHDDVRFEDPAFGPLQGEDAKKMWRMLIHNSKGNIKITYSDVEADETTGRAHWVAEYEFSATKRHVVNRVWATFGFKDGKIIRHTDRFNLWQWSRQAMGPIGFLLGWTPFFKNKIQQRTKGLLAKYEG